MSKIGISGNLSGTGVFTLASPNSNTDRTLTLPDETGVILTDKTLYLPQKGIPIVSAFQNAAQSLPVAPITKINYQAEEIDTHNFFNTSTSRFTPTIGGWYHITASFGIATTPTTLLASIFKNGVGYRNGVWSGSASRTATVSAIVYLNGTTDNVEIYASTATAQNTTGTAGDTYFQAHLVRAD